MREVSLGRFGAPRRDARSGRFGGRPVLVASLVLFGLVVLPAVMARSASADRRSIPPAAGVGAWATDFGAQGVDGVAHAVIARSDGLWIGGEFGVAGDRVAQNVAHFTGAEWVDAGAFDDRVSCFALYEDALVAGGRFEFADGALASRIAVLDPETGWEPLGAGFENRTAPEDCEVFALLSLEGRLYAGGTFTHADGVPAPGLAVWDGESWSAVPGAALEGTRLTVRALEPFDGGIAVAGRFERAGAVELGSIGVWREGEWTAIGEGLGDIVYDLETHEGLLIAVGYFRLTDRDDPLAGFAAWDGTSWSSWGSEFQGIDPSVRCVAEFRGELIVAGDFTEISNARYSQIARWNGTSWQRMSSGFIETGAVYDLGLYGSTLVAAGSFWNAAGHSCWGLARWGGSAWNPIGFEHGIHGEVSSMSADGESILIGGQFERAGRVLGDNTSLWNGDAWVPLGADFNRSVSAVLVAESGEYFCAGSFTDYDGTVIARNVAYYADGEWLSPRGGASAVCWALTSFQGRPVVGGTFRRAGGFPAERVASWNGTTWDAFGAGVDDAVRALLGVGRELYVGGEFRMAGGVESSRFAYWSEDTRSWFTFPSGPNDDVLALAQYGSQIVAGGDFSAVDGFDVGRIAAWDGTGWSTFGDGFDGSVRALTVHEGRLVAGGTFTHADGKPAPGLAFWDGAGWNAVDGGVEGHEAAVNALLSHGEDLVLGGDFAVAGGTVALGFAIRTGPLELEVWPGDCNNDGRVDGFDLLALARQWDRIGPSRTETGTDWSPSVAEDWEPVQATYADADGSGQVDLNDVVAVIENWGEDRTESLDGATTPAVLPEDLTWLESFPPEQLLALSQRLEGRGGVARELSAQIDEILSGSASPSAGWSSWVRLAASPTAASPKLLLELPEPSLVRVEVIDVAGRRLSDRTHVLEIGTQELNVSAGRNDLESGVYFVRVTSADHARTLRFVRLR